MTDETDAIDDLDRIAQYADLHPDAGVIEALGELALSPAEWRDVVAAALEADDPYAAVAATETGDVAETADSGAPEGGSPDANPTPDARETGSSPPERGENGESEDPDTDGSPDAGESGEPLGSGDTTSVRHTSGDRDTAESHLNEGDRDGASAPTLTDKYANPGAWAAPGREVAA